MDLDRDRVVVLLVFASPLLDMRLGSPDDGNQPEGKTQRVAYDLIHQRWLRQGRKRTLPDRRRHPDGAKQSKQQLDAVVRTCARSTGRQRLPAARPVKTTRWRRSSWIPTTSPQDADATSDLLTELRDTVLPDATEGTGLSAYVGGNTASFEDFSDKVRSACRSSSWS